MRRRVGFRRHIPVKILIIRNAKTGKEERYQCYDNGTKELIPNKEKLPDGVPVVYE